MTNTPADGTPGPIDERELGAIKGRLLRAAPSTWDRPGPSSPRSAPFGPSSTSEGPPRPIS
jgi:hypothetical protein